MNARVRVGLLISGSGSNMEVLIRSMQAPDHPAEPAIVISNRQDAPGVAKAEALGIEATVIDHRPYGADRAAFDAEIERRLIAAGTDLVAQAGFMRILDASFVNRWQRRMLNIHPSLLPLFPGLCTHEQALEAGVAVHGCTVHEVTPELDAGPILGQAVVPVEAGDTPKTLAARVLAQEHRLYPAVLRAFIEDAECLRQAPMSLFPSLG